MSLYAHINEQARTVNRNPSDGQKKAGNYQKGHVRLHGLDISIENPKGSFRSGVDPSGKPWKSQLPHHYGYIRGTEGSDGDHVDVFIGPHLKSGAVYVIDQKDLSTGDHDEHKVMLGFGSEQQARAAYCRAFSDGKGRARISGVEGMTVERFKDWLKTKRRAAGGAVYADGGEVKWDDDVKWDDRPKVPVFASDEAEDHGLSERQKLSPVRKALNPITSYPETYLRMNREAREQVKHGASQLGNGPWETTKGVGNIALGSLGYLGSPISAAYRSVIGQPVEDVTGIPREYTEFTAQLATPGIGFAKLPTAPGKAPVYPPVKMPKPQEAERAAELGDEFGMRFSRGQSEGDLDRIRYEDMAARGAYGKPLQDRAAKFFDDQYAAGQQAGRDIGIEAAGPYGVERNASEAAGAIASDMGDRLQQARTIVNRIMGRASNEATAQRGMVEDQGRVLNDVVRGPAQPVSGAREMGEVVGQNVRDAAAANRGEFRARYNEFGQLPGEFRVDAVRGIGNRVKNDLTLRDEPIIIDDQLTPVASRAIRDLDEMSAPRIQNRADPRAAPEPEEIAAVSLRGVDQMRKKLVAYYQAARARGADGATDARAMQGIMDAFDAQIERAISERLFSGDPRALQALQEARASYARYRQTFTPRGAGDDVGTAMRRIVERNATPEEIANMIIGSGRIGSSGTPVRLANRLEQVLGADSDAWSAIRQAMWQKASQVRNSAGEVDPLRSAQSIQDFAGSTLAQRMFTPQELAAMRSHAQGVRDLERSIASHDATRQATSAQEMYQRAFGGDGIGGQQQAVFRRIVEGTATPEEISGAVFNVIGTGNPGNVSRMVRAIERVVGPDSEAMAAIRQGVWQRTIANAEGRSGMGTQRVVNNISELLHGKGSSVARALYTDAQIAKMERYAEALRRTIIPKYARTNSDTAPALLHAVRKYASAVTSAIGVGTHGGISGGLEGYAVGKLLDKAAEKISGKFEGKKLQDSLDNVMPKDRARRLPKVLPKLTRTVPFSAASGHPPNVLPKLQGPMPGRTEEEKPRP